MTLSISELIVLIRGGGEMATGIAHRLHRCHMRVLITEITMPTSVRRNVAFAEAVYEGAHTVEGVKAVRAASCDEAYAAWKQNQIPSLCRSRSIDSEKFSSPLSLSTPSWLRRMALQDSRTRR